MSTSIKRVEGNILSVQHGIIVQGCNSHGVMGSGFAASVKNLYPGAFLAYRKVFEARGLAVGEVIDYEVPNGDDQPRLVIANAITQKDYGRDPNVVYVDYPGLERCFEHVATMARDFNLPVHFPLIGCGLANGKWPVVSAIIERALGADVDKTLWIYE
jgi:O-acetyl-ADP-ribose deacetylase (regulator of RNase III)